MFRLVEDRFSISPSIFENTDPSSLLRHIKRFVFDNKKFMLAHCHGQPWVCRTKTTYLVRLFKTKALGREGEIMTITNSLSLSLSLNKVSYA